MIRPAFKVGNTKGVGWLEASHLESFSGARLSVTGSFLGMSNALSTVQELAHFRGLYMQVKEGDVIDVDTVQEFKSKEYEQPGLKTSNSGVDDVGSEEFRRGRVVIKKIGEQTKKGRWHVTLQRHKHLATIIK